MVTCKKSTHAWHLLFFAILLSTPLLFANSQTVSAASRLSGYKLTVTATNSAFDFGNSGQWLTGRLTVPANSTETLDIGGGQPNIYYFFQINGQQNFGSGMVIEGYSSTTVQFQMQLPLKFAIGTYTIKAGFVSTLYSTTIYSTPMTLRVNRITPSYIASILDDSADHEFWPAGQPYAMGVSLSITYDERGASNWKNGTYTLTFTGPQNATYTNLALDSSGNINFTFPSKKGDYTFKLTFNGTSEVYPVSEIGTTKITDAKPISIKLYSTPTTTIGGTKMLYYVVVSGIAGYPPPTGQILFSVIYAQSNLIPLAADGTVLVSITWTNVMQNYLSITYYGDYNYAIKWYVRVPITNSPVPTNGGTRPTASPAANVTLSNTPTVAETPAATAAKTAVPTNTATTATPTQIIALKGNKTLTPGTQTHINPIDMKKGPGSSGTWALWAAAALVLCACVPGIFFLRRRRLRGNKQNPPPSLSNGSRAS